MSSLQELTGLGFPLPITVAGQATAGTADEFTGVVAPFSGRVTRVQWIPKAAVTANATNFFTLNLRNRGQAGAGTTVVATRAYSATNSTAFAGETFTLSGTPANRTVVAGDSLTVERTIGGTGLAMPAGTVIVWISPN